MQRGEYFIAPAGSSQSASWPEWIWDGVASVDDHHGYVYHLMMSLSRYLLTKYRPRPGTRSCDLSKL